MLIPAVPYISGRAALSVDIAGKDDFISKRKTQISLMLFKAGKAPGLDGLQPLVFKYFPDALLERLTFIYECCIHFCYTPRLWQKSTVVFITKPGKKDYREFKNHRPIVLSNFVLKGLERLITWKMDKHTSSAYDSMVIEHIRNSLYLHGGEEDLVEWYFNYLSGRILLIPLQGDSVSFVCGQGFPQGGVASAEFWIINFNPAIKIINSHMVVGLGYADDLAAVFGGQKPEVLVPRM